MEKLLIVKTIFLYDNDTHCAIRWLLGDPYPKDKALGFLPLLSLILDNSAQQMTGSIWQMQVNQGSVKYKANNKYMEKMSRF